MRYILRHTLIIEEEAEFCTCIIMASTGKLIDRRIVHTCSTHSYNYYRNLIFPPSSRAVRVCVSKFYIKSISKLAVIITFDKYKDNFKPNAMQCNRLLFSSFISHVAATPHT